MVDTHDEQQVVEATSNGVNGADRRIHAALENTKEKIHEGYEKATKKAHEVWDQASDMSIKDAQGSLEEYVRRNPTKSMVYAATAGLVLGILIRGRN